MSETVERRGVAGGFYEAFETSPALICEADLDTATFTYVNTTFVQVLGHSEGELLGRRFLDFVHPEDLAGTIEVIDNELKRGREVRWFENRYRSKEGEYRWFEWTAVPDLSKEKISSFGRDITRRKRAELYLKDTSHILKMIAAGEPAAGIYDAIALMYESRHPGLRCSMLELSGTTLLHGGAPSLPVEYCEAVHGLEWGPEVGSCGASTYTGKRVLVEDIATDPKWKDIKHLALPHGLRCCWSEPVKNSSGEVLGAFGMYFDHPALPDQSQLGDLEAAAMLTGIVMEREHRERTLRESENKYRTLVENLPQRFFLKDRDSIFISCSKNLAEDLGICPEQIVGTTDFDHFTREQAEIYRQQDRRVMESGDSEEFEEDTEVEGKVRTTHTVKSPALDEDGNVDGVIGIYWDITEEKALEAQFYQSQKMESVGTLVGGVAHEFNNTLAGIIGRLYLARTAAKDSPQVLNHIEKISALSDKAAEMVRQLLAFARRSPIEVSALDLGQVLQEAVKLHRLSIPESINLEVQHGRSELPVMGDSTQLQQVIMNLLHNARDAVLGAKNPKVTMALDRLEAGEEFSVTHPDQAEKAYAHLMVEDNGIGICEADIGKIFDPFFTTKEVGKGTGLGLSVVYGVVQTHKGLVDVESEPGRGTRVHVYIPLSTPDRVETQTSRPRAVPGKGEVILLADDERELREVGKEVLEALGYTILEASTGHEAVRKFTDSKNAVRLILMDVVMPEMGGVEAATKIMEHDKDAKIIFCTGYDNEDVLEGVDLGKAQVLTKPYDIEALSRIINETLGK